MKKLLLFNLLLFSGLFNTFTMEQPQKEISSKQEDLPTQPTLPTEIWYQIVKEYGVDKKALTEKEIFKNMDNLRLTSKDIKFAIDVLVDKLKKSKNKQNYTYIDFKNDIMQDILIERTKKIVPLRPTSKNQFEEYKKEIINQAFKAEAFNWSKNRSNNVPEYYEIINKRLSNTEYYKEFEKLLKMGADPNSKIISDLMDKMIDSYDYYDVPDYARTENDYNFRIPVVIKLLVKYGKKIKSEDLKFAERKIADLRRSSKEYEAKGFKYNSALDRRYYKNPKRIVELRLFYYSDQENGLKKIIDIFQKAIEDQKTKI